MADIIYSLNRSITGVGSLGIANIKDEQKIRVVVENAGLPNVIRVRGRIIGQTDWDNLADITGTGKKAINIMTYDEIEILCLVYSPSTNYVKVIATSFNEAGGAAIQVGVPSGDQLNEVQSLNFVSSDGSVSIQGISPDSIDIKVSSSGTKYSLEFFPANFIIADVDTYSLTVSASSHNRGINPTTTLYENDGGGTYSLVSTATEVDSLGNIKIIVSRNPDLRFSGKLIVE